ELSTIYLTTNSMFEAIEYVSKGDYGIISSEFSKMIPLLNCGVSPEHLLTHFATTQPSIILRRGLLTFIQSSETSRSSLDAVITDSHDNLQRKYERLTMQWESRMMVYTGLLVFLPIIIILGLSIRGLADNPLILLLPILQFGLSKFLLSTFLPNEMILLGE
ncbi:MAG: type II secretion system F family protein, partial [Candidatus Thorarchaeota archaeon]